MLTDKLNVNTASGKSKKDIKLLAVAGVLLLVFLGILFWLFSGNSKDSDAGRIAPVNANQPQVKTSPPIVIDEQAVQNINANASEQTPPSAVQNNQDNIIDPQAELNFAAQASNYLSAGYFPAGAEENSVQAVHTPPLLKQSDMKEYLNKIKKDIVIKDGKSFNYLGKTYKKGDMFNSLYVVDIGDFYIRFSVENWEYSLRLLGGLE
jgi:hypothetical protein